MKVASSVGDTNVPKNHSTIYVHSKFSSDMLSQLQSPVSCHKDTLKTRLMKDLQVGLNSVHSGEGFADLAGHQ